MLLSMFISLLLARRFKEKVYVLLMIVFLVIVSLVSIGVPSVWGTLEWHWLAAEYIGEETTIWQLNIPAIPLSFPFHTSISRPIMAQLHDVLLPEYVRLYPLLPMYEISLYFLTIKFWSNSDLWVLTSQDIILLGSSFLLINFVGAILGYWISKTTFIDKLLKKGQNISP